MSVFSHVIQSCWVIHLHDRPRPDQGDKKLEGGAQRPRWVDTLPPPQPQSHLSAILLRMMVPLQNSETFKLRKQICTNIRIKNLDISCLSIFKLFLQTFHVVSFSSPHPFSRIDPFKTHVEPYFLPNSDQPHDQRRTHIHHQFYHQDGQRSLSPFSELRSGWTWSMGEVYVSTTLASQRHPRGLAIDTDTASTRSPTASSSPALVGEVWGSC